MHASLFKRFGSMWSRMFPAASTVDRERTALLVYANASHQELNPYIRRTIIALARFLYENVGFVKGAINDLSRYTIGPGLVPKSVIPDFDLAARHDDYWEEWAQRPLASSDTTTFYRLQRMICRAVDVDGDIGFSRATVDGEPKLQAWESHVITGGDSGQWFDGVQVNGFGLPSRYRVMLSDNPHKERDFSAGEFYLVMDPLRADQRRGMSSLYHALNNVRDKRDIIGFEKSAVKLISALGMVIKSTSSAGAKGFFGPQTQDTTSEGSNLTLEKVFGGSIPHLRPGEDIAPIHSNRPSPTFNGFLETLDRDVATGLGVPLEFVWDSTRAGGVSQRFVLEKAQSRFEERQDDPLMPFTGWVRRWVIADGITKGRIPEHPLWWKYAYQRRSKITVDVGRESVANREDVRGGLRTIQEDYGERGRNWIDARSDNQKAARDLILRAKELVTEFGGDGLTLDAAVKMLEDRTPAQIMIGQPGQPSDAKGSVSTPTRP